MINIEVKWIVIGAIAVTTLSGQTSEDPSVLPWLSFLIINLIFAAVYKWEKHPELSAAFGAALFGISIPMLVLNLLSLISWLSWLHVEPVTSHWYLDCCMFLAIAGLSSRWTRYTQEASDNPKENKRVCANIIIWSVALILIGNIAGNIIRDFWK